MPNNIYPDNSADRFNTRYGRLKILPSDLFVNKQGGLVQGDPGTGGGGTTGGGGIINPGGGVVVEVIPNPPVPVTSSANTPILIFLDRFRVQPGGTMEEGDTSYVNPALAGYDFYVLSNGIEISQAIIPEQRYVSGVENVPTELYFNGGVFTNEVIEIYLKFYPKHNNLIDWFIVGPVGGSKRMNEGDTSYVNDILSNGKFIVYSNEIAIHQLDDNAGERYCTKPDSGAGDNEITFNGGVFENEIIHIYKVYSL